MLATGEAGGFAHPDSDFLRVRRNPSRELAAKKVGAGVDGTHCHSTFLLEQELQCELNQARIIDYLSDLSESGRVRSGSGIRELWMIEDVEDFGAEDELCLFRKDEGLEKRTIEVDEVGAV